VGKDVLSFSARGYGEGEMVWKMPALGRYGIRLVPQSGEGTLLEASTSSSGQLRLSLPSVAIKPVRVEIRKIGNDSPDEK
jgi:hypothetical protein